MSKNRSITVAGATFLASLFLVGCESRKQTPPMKLEEQRPEVDAQAEEFLESFPNIRSQPSIVHILAHPEKYQGRKVQVEGYMQVRFEGTAIYLSKESADHLMCSNGFWVSFDKRAIPHEGIAGPKRFDNKYVLIEGTFDMDNRGHASLWSGAIVNVDRIEER